MYAIVNESQEAQFVTIHNANVWDKCLALLPSLCVLLIGGLVSLLSSQHVGCVTKAYRSVSVGWNVYILPISQIITCSFTSAQAWWS